MRTIRKIHKAISAPVADLLTYRALPTASVDYLDPFLFLNHHGPQVYPRANRGLPFGPHPHRGMETVTFILSGDIAHKDNGGHESVIHAGGVQWMTAGRGLIHSEVSSDSFKKEGGLLEILQLWVNLPARSKMTDPFYKGLQKEEIPVISFDGGKITAQLIFGNWDGQAAAFESGIGLQFATLYLQAGARLERQVPADHNIFLYVVSGQVDVNGSKATALELVEFDHDNEQVALQAETQSIVLFGHAAPLNEPMVAQGPFVMNSEHEIAEAYEDYQNGKFGTWKE